MRRRSLRSTASRQVARAVQQDAATDQERQELVAGGSAATAEAATSSDEPPRIDRGLEIGLDPRSTRASEAASKNLDCPAESGPRTRGKPGVAVSELGPATDISREGLDPSSSSRQRTRFGNSSQADGTFAVQMSKPAATSAAEVPAQRRKHIARGEQQVKASWQPGDGSDHSARPSPPQATCSLEGYRDPSECRPHRMKPTRSRSQDDRADPILTVLEQDRDSMVAFDKQFPPQTPISRMEVVSNDPHGDEQVSDVADAGRVEREDKATGTSTDEIGELLGDSTGWVRLQLGPNLPLTCQYLPLHGTARFGRVEKMASGRYRLVLSMNDAREKEADPSVAAREYVYWLEPGKRVFHPMRWFKLARERHSHADEALREAGLEKLQRLSDENELDHEHIGCLRTHVVVQEPQTLIAVPDMEQLYGSEPFLYDHE